MAYVKTDWENLPSTDTPVTETALDNMENGIEYNDQRLNGTKPMGSIVVDDVKCKNMLNKNSWTKNYINPSTGAITSSNNAALFNYIEVNPSTEYTISFSSAVNDCKVAYYDASGTWLSSSAAITTTTTITTPSNAKYIRVYVNVDGNGINQTKINNINCQIEVGTTSSLYTTYKNFDSTYKWDIIQNKDTVFTETAQSFPIPYIEKYDRIRVAVNSSYNRTYFVYFEKNDLIGNDNIYQKILDFTDNVNFSSLVAGRITLNIPNQQISIIYDKKNATFPLTLKSIIGYYRGEQTSPSTSGTRMLSVESEEENR